MLCHLIKPGKARTLILLVLVCGTFATRSVEAQKAMGGRVVRLVTRDGKVLEGSLSAGGFTVNGATSPFMSGKTLLSINLAEDANARESERITADIAAVQNTDRAARDTAVAELTDIGLPALTPVLNAYKDRDLHEPDALYRLFGRLMPGYADAIDRSLDLIRSRTEMPFADGWGLSHLRSRCPAVPRSRLPYPRFVRWRCGKPRSRSALSCMHCDTALRSSSSIRVWLLDPNRVLKQWRPDMYDSRSPSMDGHPIRMG